jgi:Coenzyme PQQ synthesis protein D (PqqD)
MLTVNDRLQSREEEVAAKVIDGEAILINLGNGIYYSMDKVGGLIWEMVEQRHTLKEVVDAVVERYQVAREQAEADVLRLSEELLQENLVTMVENGITPGEKSNWGIGERLAYEAPQLNIYRDMGDLLALDPPTPGLQNIAWKEPDDETSK